MGVVGCANTGRSPAPRLSTPRRSAAAGANWCGSCTMTEFVIRIQRESLSAEPASDRSGLDASAAGHPSVSTQRVDETLLLIKLERRGGGAPKCNCLHHARQRMRAAELKIR